jgi:hypothetical protein
MTECQLGRKIGGKMKFKSEELAVQLNVAADGDDDVRAPYMFVVGCGAKSTKCDNTQPLAGRPPYKREEPVDFESGTSLTVGNLESLKFELNKRLGIVEKALVRAKKLQEKESKKRKVSGRGASSSGNKKSRASSAEP